MSYIKICYKNDIEEGRVRVFKNGRKTVLVGKLDGEYYALNGICTHDGNQLEETKILDYQVECPRHGARFDIKTGEVTQMPATYGLKKYDIKEENGDILVKLGS